MNEKNNKIQIYVAGGLIGAIIGVAAAYLLDKSTELEGERTGITGKKVSKTALGVVSLLWSLIEKNR